MSDEQKDGHPRGAFVFMILFLLILALGWLNVYLRLWF